MNLPISTLDINAGDFTAAAAFLASVAALITACAKLRSAPRDSGSKGTSAAAAARSQATDPGMRQLFEGIEKEEAILRVLGLSVQPDEVGALQGLRNEGLATSRSIRMAWPYRIIERDDEGRPINFRFRLNLGNWLLLYLICALIGIGVLLAFAGFFLASTLPGPSAMVIHGVSSVLLLVMMFPAAFGAAPMAVALEIQRRKDELAQRRKGAAAP